MMIRFVLLGLVTIALVAIAPLVGATNKVSVNHDNPWSGLLARDIFDFVEELEGDFVEELEGKEGEEVREHRSERREEGDFEERGEDGRRFWTER